MVWIRTDRKILEMIIQKFNGGPVGLDTLAAAIGEDAGTIEDVYEPYLIQYGFFKPHAERTGGYGAGISSFGKSKGLFFGGILFI